MKKDKQSKKEGNGKILGKITLLQLFGAMALIAGIVTIYHQFH